MTTRRIVLGDSKGDYLASSIQELMDWLTGDKRSDWWSEDGAKWAEALLQRARSKSEEGGLEWYKLRNRQHARPLLLQVGEALGISEIMLMERPSADVRRIRAALFPLQALLNEVLWVRDRQSTSSKVNKIHKKQPDAQG